MKRVGWDIKFLMINGQVVGYDRDSLYDEAMDIPGLNML
jgi:hypothetical protein